MVCALMLSALPAAVAQEDKVIGECLARVQFNLRAQADESAEKICNLTQGAELAVLESGEEWCKVRTANGAHTGYAKTSWLKYIRLYGRDDVAGGDCPRNGGGTGYPYGFSHGHGIDAGYGYGGDGPADLSGHRRINYGRGAAISA